MAAIRSSLSLRKTLLNKAVQTETRENPLQTIESVLNNNTTNRKIYLSVTWFWKENNPFINFTNAYALYILF